GQAFMVEMLKQLGLPREVSVAPGTEPADREVPVDTHAPHVVGDPARERLDASDVATPLLECLPSHWPLHGFQSVRPTITASNRGLIVPRKSKRARAVGTSSLPPCLRGRRTHTCDSG